MNEFTVTLPLPPERLHPNRRMSHHIGRSKLIADTRATAKLLTKQAMPRDFTPAGIVEIEATFWMPRKRDFDNLVAWAKHNFDGVADALGVNDSRFRVSLPQQVTGKAAGGERKLVLVIKSNTQCLPN